MKQSTTLFRAILILIILLPGAVLRAHCSFSEHRADFYAVLPFCQSPELDAWMKCISSDMIDNYRGTVRPEFGEFNFYEYLKVKYPPFKCKHRLLFHWGFNSFPWTDFLQKKVEGYGWDIKTIDAFKEEIRAEQKRRNSAAVEMTEKLFGYASSGRDAAYANAIVSIVYDLHLIGDYTSDNTDLDGLQLFRSAVGDLINSLRRLDETGSKEFIKKIQKEVNTDEDIQIRADNLMRLLHQDGPSFFLKVQDGSLAIRWKEQGIQLK